MAEYDEFDWSDPKSIVVKRVNAIAVYKNDAGDIVIRQERAMVQVDAIVTIPPQHVYTVIEAIQRQLKGPLVTPSTLG